MILHLASTLKRKTLIVVTSTILLQEMVEKCQTLIGITPTVVGGSKKYKDCYENITVCMINSIHKVDLTSFGAILVDECDSTISTESRQKIWYECNADYIYGFTATLIINNQEDILIHLFFGSADHTMYEQNFTPVINVVRTNYKYSGIIDDQADFAKLMNEQSEDIERNALIAKIVKKYLPGTETRK